MKYTTEDNYLTENLWVNYAYIWPTDPAISHKQLELQKSILMYTYSVNK